MPEVASSLDPDHRNLIVNLASTEATKLVFQRMITGTFGLDVHPNRPYLYIPEGRAQEIEGNPDFVTLMRTPDFIVVDPNKPGNLSLVEVRYHRKLRDDSLRNAANQLSKSWPNAWMLIGTPEGFFMGRCISIRERGTIPLFVDSEFIPGVNPKQVLKVEGYHEALRETLGIPPKDFNDALAGFLRRYSMFHGSPNLDFKQFE